MGTLSLGLIICLPFAPNMSFRIMQKKLYLGLIQYYILPHGFTWLDWLFYFVRNPYPIAQAEYQRSQAGYDQHLLDIPAAPICYITLKVNKDLAP